MVRGLVVAQPLPDAVDGVEELERYLERLRTVRNLSPHTLRNYRSDLVHFLQYLDAHHLSVTDVGRTTYREYLGGLQTDGIAPGSLRRRGSTIKSFFKHLHAEHVLTSNPLRLAGTPKIPQRLPGVLSVDEVEALIAAPEQIESKPRQGRKAPRSRPSKER